jgi:hypothetical protein
LHGVVFDIFDRVVTNASRRSRSHPAFVRWRKRLRLRQDGTHDRLASMIACNWIVREEMVGAQGIEPWTSPV